MTDILSDLLITSNRGRKAVPVVLEYVRDLNEADLDLIQNPPPTLTPVQELSKLRHTHHLLARCIADGAKDGESALITGYNLSTISRLKSDPMFNDLVGYYKAQADAKYLDVHQRLASLGLSSLDELQDRLENDPKALSNKDLMELAELCLDRSIVSAAKSPQGGGAAVNINLKFVDATPKEKVIEGTAVQVTVP